MSADPQVIDTLGTQAGEAWEALQKAYAAWETCQDVGSRSLSRLALSMLQARAQALTEALAAMCKAVEE